MSKGNKLCSCKIWQQCWVVG